MWVVNPDSCHISTLSVNDDAHDSYCTDFTECFTPQNIGWPSLWEVSILFILIMVTINTFARCCYSLKFFNASSCIIIFVLKIIILCEDKHLNVLTVYVMKLRIYLFLKFYRLNNYENIDCRWTHRRRYAKRNSQIPPGSVYFYSSVPAGRNEKIYFLKPS